MTVSLEGAVAWKERFAQRGGFVRGTVSQVARGSSATTYKCHDLDHIAGVDRGCLMLVAADHAAVLFDGDAARLDAKMFEHAGDHQRRGQLMGLTVEGDLNGGGGIVGHGTVSLGGVVGG